MNLKLKITTIILFTILFQANHVYAICPDSMPLGMILCDDFEDETWTYGDKWGVTSGIGWARTSAESRPGTDGSWSINGNSALNYGAVSGSYLASDLGMTDNIDFDFYVEAWVKFDENWVAPCRSLAGAPCTGTAYSNLFRVQPATGGVGLEVDFADTPANPGSLWITNPGAPVEWGAPWPFSFGTWHKVGMHFGIYDQNEGFFRLWVDENNPTIENAAINKTGYNMGPFNHFRMFYYAKRASIDGRTDNSNYWVDDVEIWNGLPSEESDTMAPNAPAGLIIL